MCEPMILQDHTLVQHKLALLRDKSTGTKDFRNIINELAMLMCYEVTRDLAAEEVNVQTPIGTANVRKLSGHKLVFVPVLRAGLGMLDGMLAIMPTAKVGHIGLYRDPESLQPVEYYCKLPEDVAQRDIVLLDPMLATGGSACDAVRMLREKGAKRIKCVSVLAAPEGLAKLHTTWPDVQIYVAALDEKLNEHGYIVPGLGDAGDRIFGTK